MVAACFQAAVPEPYRIFGVRLLPLSLGRYRLLMRFECAFVAEGEASVTMDDLLLGILICSMRCEEFLEFIQSDGCRKELRRWGKRIGKEIKHDRYFNLLAKFGLFRAYLAEASKLPNHWDETEGESVSGSHWSQNVEVSLRSDLGYTREEIEEGPLAKAIEDFFKLAENRGKIRMMTEEEVAAGEANARVFENVKLPPDGIGQMADGKAEPAGGGA